MSLIFTCSSNADLDFRIRANLRFDCSLFFASIIWLDISETGSLQIGFVNPFPTSNDENISFPYSVFEMATDLMAYNSAFSLGDVD